MFIITERLFKKTSKKKKNDTCLVRLISFRNTEIRLSYW